jgi:hypothetical protein
MLGVLMRDLHVLNQYRDRQIAQRIYGWSGDGTCGAFRVPSPIDGQTLVIVASSEDGWDHVSVSRANRCPNWPEMAHVRRLFFRDEETVMQLHVPIKDHIDLHPHCLHLWRPQNTAIPLPPTSMV